MSESNRRPMPRAVEFGDMERPLPAAWREFILYCREMQHGEIERLCIQDGLPVLAEVTRKKVKFKRDF